MLKLSRLSLLVSTVLITCSCSPLFAQPIVSKSDLTSIDSGSKETSLGDLVTDALRSTTSADVAFIPSSALRQESLPSANLQSDQLAEVLVATTAPENAFVTLHLKGRQILAALERSVSHYPAEYDGFLQVSGIKFTFDPSKPAGSRVVSVTMSDGTPLSPDAQYISSMTQPLGRGGMGYWQIWNQSDISTTSDGSLASAMITYGVGHQPLSGQTDGRIKSQ